MNRIGIHGTIWQKIKGGCRIDKGDIIAGCHDFFGMGTFNGDIKAQVKSPFLRNWQVPGHAAYVHVFGAEQEKLLFFQDMRHVII